MDYQKLSAFGLRQNNILAIVAEHRKVNYLSTSRLIMVLKPRERKVAEYLIATPAQRRNMRLNSELKQAAKLLIRWSDHNKRTLPPPS